MSYSICSSLSSPWGFEHQVSCTTKSPLFECYLNQHSLLKTEGLDFPERTCSSMKINLFTWQTVNVAMWALMWTTTRGLTMISTVWLTARASPTPSPETGWWRGAWTVGGGEEKGRAVSVCRCLSVHREPCSSMLYLCEQFPTSAVLHCHSWPPAWGRHRAADSC